MQLALLLVWVVAGLSSCRDKATDDDVDHQGGKPTIIAGVDRSAKSVRKSPALVEEDEAPRRMGNPCLPSLSIPSEVPPPLSATDGQPPRQPPGTREYWITVEPECWNVAPAAAKSVTDRITASQATFLALRFHAYSRGFGKKLPADPLLMLAGPVIEANVGDKIVIHFRNLDHFRKHPHSMHLHGVHYESNMDGAYSPDDPERPGTAVRYGEVFTYTYEARADSAGVWPYHDHSVEGALNTSTGMFGAVRIHSSSEPRFDREFYLFMHGLEPGVTGLTRDFDAFNGRVYMDDAPHLMVKKGQVVRLNVLGFGNEFHTFHVHGFRWERQGVFEDVRQIGPAMAWFVQFQADNAGMWMYHCHVEQHMLNGMMGMFMVED